MEGAPAVAPPVEGRALEGQSAPVATLLLEESAGAARGAGGAPAELVVASLALHCREMQSQPADETPNISQDLYNSANLRNKDVVLYIGRVLCTGCVR